MESQHQLSWIEGKSKNKYNEVKQSYEDLARYFTEGSGAVAHFWQMLDIENLIAPIRDLIPELRKMKRFKINFYAINSTYSIWVINIKKSMRLKVHRIWVWISAPPLISSGFRHIIKLYQVSVSPYVKWAQKYQFS